MKHEKTEREKLLRRRIRILLWLFIVALALSGLTAFPLEWELEILTKMAGAGAHSSAREYSGLAHWLVLVRDGLRATNDTYPFLAYGTDWLAFAHLMIAVAFIGPLRDPVRNVWIIEWGLICCAAIIPLALICGPVRGIPFGWQLVDCSFGIVGAVPLWWCWKMTRELATLTPHN